MAILIKFETKLKMHLYRTRYTKRIIRNVYKFHQHCSETVRIIFIKFEINLKTYVEITRHILQTYISMKIKHTVEKNN